MKNIILACAIILGTCCACTNRTTVSDTDSVEVVIDSIDSTVVDTVVIDSIQ